VRTWCGRLRDGTDVGVEDFGLRDGTEMGIELVGLRDGTDVGVDDFGGAAAARPRAKGTRRKVHARMRESNAHAHCG
jgi:hypothetical protein